MNFWYWLAIWWVFGAVVNQFSFYWYMGRLTVGAVIENVLLGAIWPALLVFAMVESEDSILDKVLVRRPKKF